MTDDEIRHLLAEALWRIDTGQDSIPLAQASPSSHRVYVRAATDLLPTVRTIAAAELREAASEVMREQGTASLAAKHIRTRCIELDAA
jgi:hypothetical protein